MHSSIIKSWAGFGKLKEEAASASYNISTSVYKLLEREENIVEKRKKSKERKEKNIERAKES